MSADLDYYQQMDFDVEKKHQRNASLMFQYQKQQRIKRQNQFKAIKQKYYSRNQAPNPYDAVQQIEKIIDQLKDNFYIDYPSIKVLNEEENLEALKQQTIKNRNKSQLVNKIKPMKRYEFECYSPLPKSRNNKQGISKIKLISNQLQLQKNTAKKQKGEIQLMQFPKIKTENIIDQNVIIDSLKSPINQSSQKSSNELNDSNREMPRKQMLFKHIKPNLQIQIKPLNLKDLVKTSLIESKKNPLEQQTFLTESLTARAKYRNKSQSEVFKWQPLTVRKNSNKILFTKQSNLKKRNLQKERLNKLITVCKDFEQEGKIQLDRVKQIQNQQIDNFAEINNVLNENNVRIEDEIFGQKYIKQVVQDYKREIINFHIAKPVHLLRK